MPPDVAALAALLADGDVLVLTGAGVSTDSGIPDYRGADGRMRHRAPMTYQQFTGSEEARRHYWARSHLAWGRFERARPNPTHQSVAALERAGLTTGVVTQNVDGLHRDAGARDVIPLHGRLDRVVCLGCDRAVTRVEMGLRLDVVNRGWRDRHAPALDRVRADGDVVLDPADTADFVVVDCRACGGTLKPDVVFFGEPVPRERFRASLERLDRSRALLVLGSSLAVGSGYRFVTSARRRGLPVAVVTRGVTRADHLATLRLDVSLADVLPAALPPSALEQLGQLARTDDAEHRADEDLQPQA